MVLILFFKALFWDSAMNLWNSCHTYGISTIGKTYKASRLVHELGTHRIEFEMQNEELHNTEEDLEESRLVHSFQSYRTVTVAEWKLHLSDELSSE